MKTLNNWLSSVESNSGAHNMAVQDVAENREYLGLLFDKDTTDELDSYLDSNTIRGDALTNIDVSRDEGLKGILCSLGNNYPLVFAAPLTWTRNLPLYPLHQAVLNSGSTVYFNLCLLVDCNPRPARNSNPDTALIVEDDGGDSERIENRDKCGGDLGEEYFGYEYKFNRFWKDFLFNNIISVSNGKCRDGASQIKLSVADLIVMLMTTVVSGRPTGAEPAWVARNPSSSVRNKNILLTGMSAV
ncbi:hypothetical protein EVAR_66308_1 [Eumeta japonica]|uniref:Uncharacterized protein n=1 Tax=Eumeta variegata TaxID=151549 RepID=A0A4C1Z9D5_EUMVA|nr:hypothetical protein EVAR_66308_1 [Eumeta japonica]